MQKDKKLKPFDVSISLAYRISEWEDIQALSDVLARAGEEAEAGRKGLILCQLHGRSSMKLMSLRGQFIEHGVAEKIVKLLEE